MLGIVLTKNYMFLIIINENMSSKQEVTRGRVVTFYQKNKEKGKSFTVNHFIEEGLSRSGVFRILQNFENRLTTERALGSGSMLRVMTQQKIRQLYKDANHSDKFNYSSAGRKYGCSDVTIKRWLNKRQIKRFKKKKSPKYTENQKMMAKRQCAWLYRYCRRYDFVIDDEKYFTLTHSLNDSYFSSPTKSKTHENVSHKPKAKFEPKLMLWIAISKYGISKSYFKPSGLAINQNVYLNKCVKKRLIPFIRDKHSDNNYMFWPDKASSHYAEKVVKHLKEQNIRFVSKYRNPTNVPQCRPIEDFFGYLCQKVYDKGWSAKTIP